MVELRTLTVGLGDVELRMDYMHSARPYKGAAFQVSISDARRFPSQRVLERLIRIHFGDGHAVYMKLYPVSDEQPYTSVVIPGGTKRPQRAAFLADVLTRM